MKILYFISSFGFGHASRSIAVIRELLDLNIEVIIYANLPNWLFKYSFYPIKVKYIKGLESLGVIYNENTFKIDSFKTKTILNRYFKNYNSKLKEIIKLCKKYNIDLILSDIEPIAFDVSDILKIDSIGISNFTWYDIYLEMYKTDFIQLNQLKEIYSKATLLFRLPFHFKLSYFKKIIDVPLVFKKITRSKSNIKKILGIKDSDKLIFIQFGGHKFKYSEIWQKKLLDILSHISNLKILFNTFINIKEFKNFKKYIRKVPLNDVEIQDYINASNIIVGKTGYSLVSEVIGYNKPFFYTIRTNWAEDILLKQGIDKYGVGKFYESSDLINGNWIDDLINWLDKENLKPKYQIEKYGQNFIKNYILENYL